jgi:hypothetical protein
MAKIKRRGTVTVVGDFTFNEEELRALEALVCYGETAFLKVFYEHLGTVYMKPHEQGLRSVFKSIREEVPMILNELDTARKLYEDDE